MVLFIVHVLHYSTVVKGGSTCCITLETDSPMNRSHLFTKHFTSEIAIIDSNELQELFEIRVDIWHVLLHM